MKRRHLLGAAAALALAAGLALAPSGPARAQDVVKIANIAELSGPGATAGVN